MQLSEQQVRFFETFGYLSFPGAFAAEAEAISEEFERVWAERGGGHWGREHDRQQRSAFVPFIDQSEYLSALIDDPRIDGVAAALLGDDYNYESSDGNFYVGNTRWHSDGFARTKYRFLKFAFYLDPVTAESGCLRVIPGSHHRRDEYAKALHGVMGGSRMDQTQDALGVSGPEVPAVALETQPGDLIMFNQDLKHASYGGGTRRRMFTINMSERFDAEDLDTLRNDVASLVRFWAERAYGDAMVRTAGPKRMVHLEQRMANDDHLPGLVAKAREEMSEPARG